MGQGHASVPFRVGACGYLSLLGFVAGLSLGLLLPGACAGLPDGNWPGGKLALDGAMRSSNFSIRKRPSFSLHGSIANLLPEKGRNGTKKVSKRPHGCRTVSRNGGICAHGDPHRDRKTAGSPPTRGGDSVRPSHA